MTPEERQAFKVEIIKDLIFEFLERVLKKNRGGESLIPNLYGDEYTDADFQREMEAERIKMEYLLPEEDINDLQKIAELFVLKVSDRDSSTDRDNAIFELYREIEKRHDMKEDIMQDAIAEIFYVFNLYGGIL